MADPSPGHPAERAASPATDRPVRHLAARIDDAVHGFRRRVGARRGLRPTVVPFPGYGGPGWIRVLARVVLARPDRPLQDRAGGIRGWRSFTSVPVGDAEVQVEAAGTRRTLGADRGGVVDAHVDVDLPAGWNEIRLSVGAQPAVTVRVFVVDAATRFGVVSDIDDTVMVTALPRPFLAAWNTFVLDEHARRPVPGMAVLYERLTLAHPGAPVIYLSTGAWNVLPTLNRFLGRNLYPTGALLLTDWGPTHDRWFRSGQDHKRRSLARLAEEFPTLKWLLIGDDGQHDETLYGEFALAHPANTAAIAIRQLTPGEAVLAGGRRGPDDSADTVRRVYAPDGAGLSAQLTEVGIL